MSTYIKNVELGSGKTKICLPIIAKTREDILREGREFRESAADIVEWRVDFYEDVMNIDKVLKVAEELTDVLLEKPVLFTFRTKNEGGECAIDTVSYKQLIKSIIKQQRVGAVDVELFMGEGLLEELVAEAEEYGVRVVASNHDFDKTPDKETIVDRLVTMKNKGAHVSKLAAMPRNEQDVLNLLQATYDAKSQCPDMTLITMSMGTLGVISRIGGGVFGSAMTFGAKTKELASAPGQVEVNQLKSMLEVIYK